MCDWKRYLAITVVICLGFAGGAQASAKSIDLPRLKTFAGQHSPILRAKAAEIGIEEGTRTIVRAPLLPHLSLSGSYNRYRLNHAVYEGLLSPQQVSDDERYTGSISFNFVVFDFGKNYYNYRGADLLVNSKKRDYQRQWETLSFQLSQLYYSLLTVEKTTEAIEENIKSLTSLKNHIAKEVEVGRLAEVDQLKVEVDLAKSIDDRAQITVLHQRLMGDLRRLAGFDETDEVALKPVPLGEVKDRHYHLQELLERAYRQRSDLKSIEENLKGLNYRKKSVLASYLPEVGVNASYIEQAPGDGDFKSDGVASVVISMPIFDGFQRKGALDKLHAQQRQFKSLLKAKRLEIEKDVKTALVQYRESLNRLTASRRSTRHAEEVVRIERLKYQLGRTNIDFLLQAESSLLRARSLYYQAYYDTFTARENIGLATGELGTAPQPPGPKTPLSHRR